MAGINITAQLQGPNNLRSFVQNIQSQLNGISANINLNISPSANSALNRLNTSIGQLNSNINTLNSSMSKIGAVSSNVTNNINNVNNAVNRVNSTISKTRGYFTETSSAMENFGQVAGLAARRFLGFSVAAGTIIKFTSSIKEGVKEALEFQNTMVKLKQVSEGSSEGIRELQSEISRLATSFGVSSKELSETALTLRQAGLSINEVKIAMESLAKSSLAPTFDGMSRTVEGVIAIMSQFKIQAKDVENALGSINAASAAFAVESADIIEAVKRAGGAFKSVGGNLNEFIALFTAVRSTTRESADNIATGLRTIFTRLQRNDTVEALKSLQINLRYTREEAERMGDGGLENQFVGAYEAVKRLGEGLKGLRNTDPRYSAVVEQLGGYRQISRVIPLLQEATTIQKAYTVAQSGQISMTIAAATAQESYLVKIQKVKEQFLELVRTLTNSGSFKTVVDTTLTLASSLIKVTDALTPLLPMLTTLAAIKMTSGLAGLGVGFMGGITGRSNPKLFASGGHVPGSGNRDTVDAKLTPGEYVLTRSDVQKMGGPNQIDKMRKRFAFGGSISTESTGQTRFKLNDNLIGQIFADGGSGAGGDAELSVNSLTEPRKNEIKSLIRGNPKTKERVFDKRDDLTFVKAKVSSFNMQSKDKLENMINKTITPRLDRDLTDIVKNSTGGKSPRFKGGQPGSLVVKNAMNALKGSLYEGLVSAETGLDIEGETKNKNANFDFIAPSVTNFPNLIKTGILQASGSAKYIDAKTTRVDSKKILTKAVNEGLFPASMIARRMERDYLNYNTKDAMLDKNITETVAKKRHFGGILKFANGGLVPGSGNGDTEFAHMAPGSFVIKKSAVNAIGAGNLQKFAGGGEVFEWSRDKQGQSFANPYLLSLAQTKRLSDKFYGNTDGLKETDILKAAGIDKINGTQIGLKNKKRREIGKEVGRVGDNLTIPDNPLDRLGTITGGGATRGGYNIKLGVAPSDLSTEQRKGLKQIGINPANVTMVADRHVISKTRQDEFTNDVMTNVSNVISKSLAKMFPGQKGMGLNNQETANISGILLGKYVSGITGVMGAGASNEDWDFKRGAFKPGSDYPFLFPSKIYARHIDVKQNPEHINRIAGKYLNTVEDIKGRKLGEKGFSAFSQGKMALKFASGGMANGPDTVPAMLTPGEYVFNPDAVKRIGLSKLHEMNNSGSIKRFARGGFVRGGETPRQYTELTHSTNISSQDNEVFQHNVNLMTKRNSLLSKEIAEAQEWANVNKQSRTIALQTLREKQQELVNTQAYNQELKAQAQIIAQQIQSKKNIIKQEDQARFTAQANIISGNGTLADQRTIDEANKKIGAASKEITTLKSQAVSVMSNRKDEKGPQEALRIASIRFGDADRQAKFSRGAADSYFREFGVNQHIENMASGSLGGVKLGVGNVDALTESRAIEKAHTNIKSQLVEIEKQRLAVIYPNMDREKKHRLAIEGVDKALIAQEKLVFDTNGKLIGFKSALNNGTQAMSAISHEAYVSATANGKAKNQTGIDKTIYDLNEHSKGKAKTPIRDFFKKNASTLGFLGLGTGASYLSEAMAPKSGMTDEEIIRSSNYKEKKVTSSALSGASIGAMTGAVLGPWGAAAGAIIGAGLAIANSMKEAELEIEKAKINIAAKNLGVALEGAINVAKAKTSISTIDQGIAKEAALNNSEGRRYWTDDIPEFFGFDGAGTGTRKRLEQNNEFIAKRNQIYSGQLPAFSKALSTQAEGIGERFGPNIFKNGIFEREMLKGANGLNKEMLTKISQLKGIPIQEVLKEFAESARMASRRLITEQANVRGQSGFNFFISGITKFNDAITAAAESGNKFGVTLENIQNEISGSFGPRKMTDFSAGFGMIGRNSPEFRDSLNVVSNMMGGGNDNFRQIADAIDRVSNELPTIMNGVFADFGSGRDPQTLVKEQLRKNLGVAQNDNFSATATYIDKVVGKMAEQGDLKDINKIINAAGGAERFAKGLTQADRDDVAKTGADSISKMMQIFSERSSGINNFFKTTSLANQETDRASSIKAEMDKAITTIENERLGNREADAFSLNPFIERQNRFNGGDFNPVNIRRSIENERANIGALEKKRDDALKAGDMDNALKFNNAIEESNNQLKNFRDALGNAAGAAKQETQILLDKVRLLQEERSQRLGAAEVMKFGSSKERQDMANQAKIAQRALDFGTENMGDKERADALAGLNRFSRTSIFRDKQGNMISGEQAKMQIINNDPTMKGVVDTPAMDAAKEELKNAYKKEIDATNELSRVMQDLAKSIEATSKERTKTQLDELARQKSEKDKAGLTNQISTKENQLGQIGYKDGRDFVLGKNLVENNDLFKDGVFQENKFNAMRDLGIRARQRHDVLHGSGQFKVDRNYVDVSSGKAEYDREVLTQDILTHLDNIGIKTNKGDIAENIVKTFKANNADKLIKAGAEGNLNQVVENLINDAIRSQLHTNTEVADYKGSVKNFATAMGWKKDDGSIIEDITDLGHNREKKLIKAQNSVNAMSPEQVSTFLNLMKNVERYKGFDNLEKSINKLTEQIDDLKKQRAEFKASGGPIGFHPGSPSGTDTVPAWLTPGEIVLNKKAALMPGVSSLAKSLNAGKALHLAEGGPVTELTGSDKEKWLSAKVWADREKRILDLRDVGKNNEADALVRHRELLKQAKYQKYLNILNPILKANPNMSEAEFAARQEKARNESGYYKFMEDINDPEEARLRKLDIQDIFRKKFEADVNFDKRFGKTDTLNKDGVGLSEWEKNALQDVQNANKPKRPVLGMKPQNLLPEINKIPAVGQNNKKKAIDRNFADFQAAMNRGLKKNAAAAWVAQNDPLFAEQMGMVQDASRFDMSKSAEYFKRTRIRQELMENMKKARFFKNGVRKFAEGGVVPGFGNQDSVPALLTPGEVVIPKRMAQGGTVSSGSSSTASFGGLKIEIPKEFTTASQMIASAFSSGIAPMIALSNSLNNIPKLVEKLSNIPTRIEMSIAPVNFIVTMPDMGGYTESLKKDMTQIVEKMINNKLNQVLNSSDTPVIGGGF